MKSRKVFGSILLFHLFLFSNFLVKAQEGYNLIWVSENNSQVRITISYNSTSEEDSNGIFKYAIEVQALLFAPNQDNFNSIIGRMRFFLANHSIMDEQALTNLNGINESSSTILTIIDEPLENFNLTTGAYPWAIQFSLTYKEGYILRPDPLVTTGWINLINGTFPYEAPALNNNLISGETVLFMLIAGGGLITFLIYTRKKMKLENKITQETGVDEKRGSK